MLCLSIFCISIRKCIAYADEANVVNRDSPINSAHFIRRPFEPLFFVLQALLWWRSVEHRDDNICSQKLCYLTFFLATCI